MNDLTVSFEGVKDKPVKWCRCLVRLLLRCSLAVVVVVLSLGSKRK